MLTGEDAVLGLPETGLAVIPGYALITHYMFAYAKPQNSVKDVLARCGLFS